MLLSNLDVLATAPGGVARLRELILTLAVQGKLLPQDSADEPASVLLQKIRAEKDRLIAEGKIKRDKPLAEIAEEDKPFELPQGWEWVCFGDVVSISSGVTLGRKTPFTKPVSLPYLRVANVQRWYLDLASMKEVVIDQVELPRFQLLRGDLLITEGGDWDKVGRTAIWRDEIATCLHQNHVFKARGITSAWNAGWAELFLNSAVARSYFASSAKQTTNLASINMTQLKHCAFPLPPLAEQSRIVTRVEELMRLCDALEAKGQLEATQHAQLVSTLLGTLTASTTPEQLADNWQRVAQHFDLLLDRPEAIDALEQTLLQLAVRGLLMPQDPTDEPASLLLARIRAEKDRLIAEGKIKRDKPLSPITEEEKPFELPVGWEWMRFPDLCSIAGGATPSKANPNFWVGEIPWVSPKDMKVPQIRDAQDHISSSAIQGSLSLIPPGSLLMVVRGMILAHSFPVAETLVPVTINQDMKAVTPYISDVLPFLLLITVGMKPEILARVERSTHGTCKLESPKIFGMCLPFPPLAEQSRIVACVTALRRLSADLRKRLTAAQATQSHLAQAIVESANRL